MNEIPFQLPNLTIGNFSSYIEIFTGITIVLAGVEIFNKNPFRKSAFTLRKELKDFLEQQQNAAIVDINLFVRFLFIIVMKVNNYVYREVRVLIWTYTLQRMLQKALSILTLCAIYCIFLLLLIGVSENNIQLIMLSKVFTLNKGVYKYLFLINLCYLIVLTFLMISPIKSPKSKIKVINYLYELIFSHQNDSFKGETIKHITFHFKRKGYVMLFISLLIFFFLIAYYYLQIQTPFIKDREIFFWYIRFIAVIVAILIPIHSYISIYVTTYGKYISCVKNAEKAINLNNRIIGSLNTFNTYGMPLFFFNIFLNIENENCKIFFKKTLYTLTNIWILFLTLFLIFQYIRYKFYFTIRSIFLIGFVSFFLWLMNIIFPIYTTQSISTFQISTILKEANHTQFNILKNVHKYSIDSVEKELLPYYTPNGQAHDELMKIVKNRKYESFILDTVSNFIPATPIPSIIEVNENEVILSTNEAWLLKWVDSTDVSNYFTYQSSINVKQFYVLKKENNSWKIHINHYEGDVYKSEKNILFREVIRDK